MPRPPRDSQTIKGVKHLREWLAKAAIVVLLFVLVSCGSDPPPPPAPTNHPDKPMIIVDSGLGGPQLAEVAAMLQASFPNANIVDFQTGRNAYLGDIRGYVAANPHSKLILIGHSFGASNCFDVAADCGPVDLLIDIDGVRNWKHKKFIVTPNVKRCVVVTGDFVGLIRESVHGPFEEYKVPNSGHNAMTKRQELLNIVRWTVEESL